MKRLLTALAFTLLATPAWGENLTIDSTPDVFAPALGSAGTAPCIVAGGAALGITGFGIAGGTGITSEDCEQRNTAALLANINERAAARAYLCMVNKDIEAAFNKIGQDCYATQKVVTQTSTTEQDQLAERRLLALFAKMDAEK